VVEHLESRELRARIDLGLGEEGVPFEGLFPILDDCLRYSVRTGHPQFQNQLYGGCDPAALVGDLFASALNTSMYTFEVAPVATLMELELIDRMNSLVGFESGEGIFCTGGSNANLLAALCARERAFPESKARGLHPGLRPVIFVSDQAHYSFLKAANLLGLGTENVIEVATGGSGSMIPDALDRAIRHAREQGAHPLMVGATAGTTVLGAFDPLEPIASICRKHEVWMHADGAWGGPVLLSRRHRRLLQGAELADSFSWDAHKMMGVTLTCTAFLTRHRGALFRACGQDEDQGEYLFHDTGDSHLDLGRISLQCGRRIDPFRLWVLWKHHGERGLEARVDRLFELTRVAAGCVEDHPRLELMAPVQSLNVCFRYRPERELDLNALNLELRERLRRRGKSFFNYSHLGDELTLRIALTNPDLTEADLACFFESVVASGDEVTATRA
jgi:glutamate/tyrosine decarboxylase-like PLP-dependent enzyme